MPKSGPWQVSYLSTKLIQVFIKTNAFDFKDMNGQAHRLYVIYLLDALQALNATETAHFSNKHCLANVLGRWHWLYLEVGLPLIANDNIVVPKIVLVKFQKYQKEGH